MSRQHTRFVKAMSHIRWVLRKEENQFGSLSLEFCPRPSFSILLVFMGSSCAAGKRRAWQLQNQIYSTSAALREAETDSGKYGKGITITITTTIIIIITASRGDPRNVEFCFENVKRSRTNTVDFLRLFAAAPAGILPQQSLKSPLPSRDSATDHCSFPQKKWRKPKRRIFARTSHVKIMTIIRLISLGRT